MSIPQNDFKLDDKIQKEYGAVLTKETDKEKMDELSKLFNKYGIGIPFEFILGGKFYMYFNAKNEEEKEEIVKNFKDSASFSIANSKVGLNIGINQKNDVKAKMANSNTKLSVIGGDSGKKDNYNEWLQSLNINNAEIIKYNILRPIHDFCDDEDVKEAIDDLLERESQRKLAEAEKELKRINEEQNKLNEINNIDDDITEDLMIIVLGDNDSGKTSFIQRYIKGPSGLIKTKKTMAVKCEKKYETISINNVIHKINVQL